VKLKQHGTEELRQVGQQRERYYTVKEAAADYFQGQVSEREVYALFARGELRGFRVGAGKGRILIYESSLEAYRLAHENGQPSGEAPAPPKPSRSRSAELPAIRLNRLPVE
jgi:hypothetical protein